MAARIRVMALVSACALAWACEDVDSHREPGGILTTPPSPPRPISGDGRNPPPIDNLKGYPDSISVSGADTRAGAQGQPEALAQLAGVGRGGSLQGTATLDQVQQGVALALSVQQGTPGTSRVMLAERGSCANPERLAKAAPKAGEEALPKELGRLRIARDGAGKLEATVPDATLEERGQGSLLGKELALLAPQGQQLLACATIEPAY